MTEHNPLLFTHNLSCNGLVPIISRMLEKHVHDRL